MVDGHEMVTRNVRYSVEHDGWFWDLQVPNPYPMHLPDGRVSVLDEHIYRGGYRRRLKSAERDMRRAERRVLRSIDKAARAVRGIDQLTPS